VGQGAYLSFQQLIDQVGKTRSVLRIGEEWLQGRACFGGLVAGLVYESMRKQIGDAHRIRSLQISFVGPVSGEMFEIESEILRQGKSVVQVMGRGIQNGMAQIVILGTFGKPRSSHLEVEPERFTFSENPNEIQPAPYIAHVTPEFTKQFDYRYVSSYPFSGSEDQTLKGFVRFKNEKGSSIPHLLGLIDAWPPTILPMLKTPSPISSVTWNLQFFQDMPEFDAAEFCQYQSCMTFAHEGYCCTSARVWNLRGKLLATSQQTVVYFG